MVHAERRNRLRFPLDTELRFQVPGERSNKAAIQGIGQAENISSKGLAFRVDRSISRGERVSVSMAWPAKLDNKCPLRLVLEGTVIRTQGTLVVLLIERSEFRTAGSTTGPAREEIAAMTHYLGTQINVSSAF